MIFGFDVVPKCNSAGDYYCGLCEPGARKLYRSRQELFADHSFERFLKWVNKNFIPSRWICLFGRGGVTWAEVVDEKDVDQKRAEESFVYAFPVIKNTVTAFLRELPKETNVDEKGHRKYLDEKLH